MIPTTNHSEGDFKIEIGVSYGPEVRANPSTEAPAGHESGSSGEGSVPGEFPQQGFSSSLANPLELLTAALTSLRGEEDDPPLPRHTPEPTGEAIREIRRQELREFEEDWRDGDRVRAAADIARSLAGEERNGPFDPSTYVFRQHLVAPSGLKPYKPRNRAYDAELVLRDPREHISVGWEQRLTFPRGFSGGQKTMMHYQRLHPDVRARVDQTPFGQFAEMLSPGRDDSAMFAALGERWWDTTNTFHLPFGEVTMTPLDLTALTGLEFRGEPIPWDFGMFRHNAALSYLLGGVPRLDNDMFRVGDLLRLFQGSPVDDQQADQKARAFLLYLLGTTLFANRRSRVHVAYLPALMDLKKVGDYNWGSPVLASLYAFMGSYTRMTGGSVGGCRRIWELWAYEILGIYCPENRCSDPTIIPRAKAWRQEHRGAFEYRGALLEFRVFLDCLSENSVRYDPWAEVEERYPFLTEAREVTRGRLLLESAYGWQWYLGDRVARQSNQSLTFVVPGPLPEGASFTDMYTLSELFDHTTPTRTIEPFVRRTQSYEEYRRARLMPPFQIDDDSRRVWEREAGAEQAAAGEATAVEAATVRVARRGGATTREASGGSKRRVTKGSRRSIARASTRTFEDTSVIADASAVTKGSRRSIARASTRTFEDTPVIANAAGTTTTRASTRTFQDTPVTADAAGTSAGTNSELSLGVRLPSFHFYFTRPNGTRSMIEIPRMEELRVPHLDPVPLALYERMARENAGLKELLLQVCTSGKISIIDMDAPGAPAPVPDEWLVVSASFPAYTSTPTATARTAKSTGPFPTTTTFTTPIAVTSSAPQPGQKRAGTSSLGPGSQQGRAKRMRIPIQVEEESTEESDDISIEETDTDTEDIWLESESDEGAEDEEGDDDDEGDEEDGGNDGEE